MSFLIVLIFCCGQVYGEESRWSIGYIMGYYKPSLKTLRRVINDSSLAIEQDPNFLLPGSIKDVNRSDRNITVSNIKEKFNYGIEAQYRIKERHSLTFTISIWEGRGKSEDLYDLPILTLDDTVLAPRSAAYNITINQFWIGWRYNLFDNKEHSTLFTNIEFLGVSLSHLTMDSLIKVVAPEFGLSFASVSSTEARGLAYTSRIGMGGEYFLRKWLSFGIKLNYVIGKTLKVKIDRYFPPNFPPVVDVPALAGDSQPTPPPPPEEGDALTFGIDTSSNVERTVRVPIELPLELNGVEASITIRFHF